MTGQWRRVTAVMCLASSLAACDVQGLAFRKDTRLHIDAPRPEATVQLPLTVRWSISDFQILRKPDGTRGSDAGYFAVFLDRDPIRVGESIDSVAAGDGPCQRTPGCPDEQYFNRRHVFTTSKTELTLEGLVDTRPASRAEALDRHELIIVLLDGSKRRIGESFHSVGFNVDRSNQGT